MPRHIGAGYGREREIANEERNIGVVRRRLCNRNRNLHTTRQIMKFVMHGAGMSRAGKRGEEEVEGKISQLNQQQAKDVARGLLLRRRD